MTRTFSWLLLLIVVIPRTAFAQTDRLPAPAQMRTLGLVGGTSWRSTVEYYRYINQEINNLYRSNTNPPLVLYNLNQNEIHALQLAGRWDSVADVLSDATLKLRAAGAQAVMFCANTPYKVYSEVSRRTGMPILHIADATGIAIQKRGLTRVGLLGTKYTMEDGFIQHWLRERYQIDTVTPSSPAVRVELHRIIQKELGMGIFRPESKRYVLSQIEDLRKRGAQGIILGCTEFPLIIHQSDVEIPVFDTTRLHAEMAVDFILRR